jgi:hypothetical protein
MSWSNNERLYNLLPAIYRVRDVVQGEPLRALLSVIETELETIESDIEGLYENWFIETSDEWVVPYIADLLGVRMLHTIESAGAYSLRAYVANTLRYRRRKGTVGVLEQLARDVTGWPARAVEFFQLLGTTQHQNHIRLHNLRTPDIRDANQLELIGTPFETASHTAEVRRIENGRGKYNIPNIGLFLWRLQSYAINRSAAQAVANPADGRYTFSPLGLDGPLCNRPHTETDIGHLAGEINVPGFLRRRALYDDLEQLRSAIAGGETPASDYFGIQPVLEVFVDEQFIHDEPVSVPPEEILICDLSDWRKTPAGGTATVAVDPVLGRLTFPSGEEPTKLHVSYSYGFSADVGGGPYNRRETVNEALKREVTWQVGVAKSPEVTAVGGETIFDELGKAVQAWNAEPAGVKGKVGIITIMDSYSYQENLTGAKSIDIPEGSQLLIVAADWPVSDVPGSITDQQRLEGHLAPTGLRPHIRGNISVRGGAIGESAGAGTLILDGLMIEGILRVLNGNLGNLQLNHCTLVPGGDNLLVNASVNPGSQNDRLRVSLLRSIVGGVNLADSVPELVIKDSIVDRPGAVAIEAMGAEVSIDSSTILGETRVRMLEASETIFMERVRSIVQQEGCIRFSHIAAGSHTPRRYRCQPDLALKGVEDNAKKESIRTRLTPQFTSDDYGDPFYLQLARACAEEIRTGSEDGSEMGVFNHLKQPQRTANLRAALDEYLPFGMRAGIFYVT